MRSGDQHRLLSRSRALMDSGDRLIAKPAFGNVDDPFKGEVVGRGLDQPQIGDGVADFSALIKTEAADDLVRQADRNEALLELTRLELGTDQDCCFGDRTPLTAQ